MSPENITIRPYDSDDFESVYDLLERQVYSQKWNYYNIVSVKSIFRESFNFSHIYSHGEQTCAS